MRNFSPEISRVLASAILASISYITYSIPANAQTIIDSSDRTEEFHIRYLNHKYNEVWQSAWIESYGKIMSEMPDPKKLARLALNEKYGKKGAIPDFKGKFDPDELYYLRFKGAVSDQYSFTGWEHTKADVISAIKLTDAVLSNAFQNIEEDSLSLYSGVYYSGYGESNYGVKNEVKVLPSEISKFIEEYDLQSRFTEKSNSFWKENKDGYVKLYRDSFGFIGLHEFEKSEISYEASLLIESMASGDFSSSKSYYFDIYGYKSNSILFIENIDNKFALLYIPGSKKPFVEFINNGNQSFDEQVRSYILQHLEKSEERMALGQHFSLYDRQDGSSYSGIDTALKGLSDGSWPSSYILEKKELISGDPFSLLAKATQDRVDRDGDVQIKSNSEVARDHALRTISAFINLMPIIDLIAPEVGVPLDIAINSTVLGLSINTTITGDSLYERQAGIYNLVGSSINMATSFIIPGIVQTATKIPFYTHLLNNEIEIDGHTFSFSNRNSIPIEYEALKVGDEPIRMIHPKTKQTIYVVRLTNEPDVIAISEVSDNLYVEVDFVTGKKISDKEIKKGLFKEKNAFYSSEPYICY
ncbi:dermonecrotic toxin domain-containing protein [Aeromonas veronii]|uniref:dermonecrotic toxin domain-containing protein n=1 Tax=Aeromonas veronii TaxID=654 RepID=UPI0038B671F3